MNTHGLLDLLRDYPDLSVRQAGGLSLAQAQGMNRGEVSGYFKLLDNLILENNLFDKPAAIFNTDETAKQ